MWKTIPCSTAALAVLLAFPGAPAAEEGKAKASPEAARALKAAAKLLNANQLEPAVEKLRSIIQSFPRDPAAEAARKLLAENGVGDEVRVQLLDRPTFRNRFKIQETEVLELAEKVLKELRFRYKVFKPFFEKSQLRLVFHENEARYRQAGGSVTTGGHFGVQRWDHRNRAIEGKIEWYFPREARTPQDRQTYMKRLLYHEAAHYLNAIHFGGALPYTFNEGLAAYFESRLVTEYYQHFRENAREHYEGEARNGLNAIAKYPDFLKMLDSQRGFGQGDAMIGRWYGLSYAVVDFFSEARIGAKKASFEELLEKLGQISQAHLKTLKEGESASPLPMRGVLEQVVQSFYQSTLEEFHRELVNQVLARYKQR